MTILSAVLALSGCVATGVRVLDDRTAIISGNGNAYASAAMVQQHVMISAAKTTVAHGFTRFVVLGADNTSGTSSYTAPGTSKTSGSYQSGYGGTGTFSQTTTYNPGQTYNFYKPGMDVTIRMFRDDDAPPNSWVASAIITATAKKH